MAKQPIINGKTVERAYEDYRTDSFLVNRRYQRKLVWSIQEKQAFIDSIMNGYPVPLFLFSKCSYKESTCNEIIDGMQRLNAIFSFIENEYNLQDGYYFDLQATAITKELLDAGNLIQREPKLSREYSVKIASYELPFSLYEEERADIIDEVFRRINANGKHLSRQEIRQAGTTSEFAQLVRKIAMEIRGDVSHADLLLLSNMKNISILQDVNHNGIDPSSIYWVQENIITKEDIRQSQDEEIIADILAAMVLPTMPPSSASILDEYYGFENYDSETRNLRIEEAILSVTPEKLREQFFVVFDEVKKVFAQSKTSFVKHILPSSNIYRAPRYYQLMFLTFYTLLVKEEMKVSNYKNLLEALNDIGERSMKIAPGGGRWSSKDKTDIVSATAGVLRQKYFERRTGGDPMYNAYSTELETLLKQSYTENSQYDFKLGVFDIFSGKKNDELILKVFRTLTAMGNSDKRAVGYIIIGVADKKEDAEKIAAIYKQSYRQVGNFCITGVNGEVDRYYGGNYDRYFQLFKDALTNMNITDYYRRQIGAKMRHINYYDRSVILLKIESDNGPVLFENEFYTRIGPNTEPIPVPKTDYSAFFKKFS